MNSVNFKYGHTLEGKTINDGDFIALNDGFAEGAVDSDKKYGSIYKGDKILGTTEADKLYTTEDITIAGGPLETELNKVFKNGKIPAGTSLHDFFKLMACTDTYPQTSSVAGSFKLSLAAPSITANGTNNNAVVEVGSTVKLNDISAKSTTVSTNTAAKVSGLTYGYKTAIGGDKVDATSVSKDWTSSVKEGDTYKLTASATGFTGLVNTTAENTTASSCVIAAQDLIVGLGTNKVTVVEDGVGYNASVDAIDSVYIISNIGSTSEDHKTVALQSQSITPDPTDSTGTFTVTGVYPVYGNFNEDSLTESADTKFAIANSSTFTKVYPAETNIRVAFAYPSNRTLTVKFWDKFANAYVAYTGGYTNVAETTKRNINGVEVQYNVWTRVDENALGSTDFQFTLSKSTSVA